MPVAVAVVGLLAGIWLGPRAAPRYSSYFRLQMLGIVLPLSFAGGWSVRPTIASGAAMVIVMAGELLGIAAAWSLASGRGQDRRFHGVSTAINSSFWSLPAALTLFGPAAATFTVLFDSLFAPLRNSLFVWMMRSSAPGSQQRRTAWVDNSRSIGAAAGVSALALAGGPPHWIDGAIETLGYAAALSGFVLLGAALPRTIPARVWREAALVMPLRFVPVTALLLIAGVAGLRVERGAWVLALAPCWFAYLSWARLYGHRGEFAAATIVLSLPIALALLPVAGILGARA